MHIESWEDWIVVLASFIASDTNLSIDTVLGDLGYEIEDYAQDFGEGAHPGDVAADIIYEWELLEKNK